MDESGDLTGVEILFLSTSSGIRGMIVFYEGYWNEPVFTPLALSKIEMNGKKNPGLQRRRRMALPATIC